MANTKDITHKQGLSPTEFFIVKDALGNPIDLLANGFTAEIRVRRGYKSTADLMETFSTNNGKLKFHNSVAGRLDFFFAGDEFQNETIKGVENSYIWDMSIVDGTSGKEYDIYEGNWILRSNL